MPEPVTIPIIIDDQGAATLASLADVMDTTAMSADTLAASISGLNDAMASAAASEDETAASTTGAAAATDELGASAEGASFNVETLNKALAGGMIAMLGLGEVANIASELNATGTEAYRTGVALDTMSNGHADEYMKAMQAATHGMVDEETLAASASLALSSGVATTKEQLAEITQVGMVLGDTFQGSATAGIQSLTQVLEMPGASRGLKQFGLDTTEVMARYKQDLADGMDKTNAWWDAVMTSAQGKTDQLAAAIENGPGSAMDRLNTRIADFRDHAGENFATGINAIIVAANNGSLATAFSNLSNNPVFQLAVGGAESIDPKVKAFADLINGKNKASTDAGITPAAMATIDQILGVSGGEAGAQPAGQAPDYALALQNAPNPDVGSILQWAKKGMLGPMPRDNWGAMTPDQQAGIGNFSGIPGADMNAGSPELTQAPLLAMKDALAASMLYLPQLQDAWGSISQGAQNYLQHIQDTLAPLQQQSAILQAEHMAEVGGTGAFNQGIASARQALITKDNSTWKGKQNEQSDLATFDKDAQYTQDQYMLATGQATQASLTYRDAQKQLSDQLGTGKISLTDYEQAMLKLADATAQGGDELTNLLKAQDALIIGGGASTTTAAKGQAQKEDALLGMGKGSGGASASDLTGLQATESIAKDLATYSDNANTNLSNIATAVAKLDNAPLKTAGDHAAALNTNAGLAVGQLTAMVTQVNLLKSGGGQYTFTFQSSTNGGSSNTSTNQGVF